jgi:hypothetical protein
MFSFSCAFLVVLFFGEKQNTWRGGGEGQGEEKHAASEQALEDTLGSKISLRLLEDEQ